MQIAVLVAGNSNPSNSNKLADEFIEGMKEVPGISFEKIQIKELALEQFSLKHYEQNPEEDFKRLKGLIESSSGIVIATPIWNFSVPAHLKNVIDRMGAFALDAETRSKGQLKGRPLYCIFTGGASDLAWKALMSLTTLHVPEAMKYFGATVVGRYFEEHCTPGRGKFGYCMDNRPQSLAHVRKEGKKFGALVKRYAETGTAPSSRRRKIGSFFFRVFGRFLYGMSEWQ